MLPLSLDTDLNMGYSVKLSHYFSLFLKQNFLLKRILQYCFTYGSREGGTGDTGRGKGACAGLCVLTSAAYKSIMMSSAFPAGVLGISL